MFKAISINDARPFVRYSRYIDTKDFKKFPDEICAFDSRLFYCKSGFGAFKTEVGFTKVEAGVLIILPPGVAYSYHPDPTEPMEFLAMNFDFSNPSRSFPVPIPPEKRERFDKSIIVEPTLFSDAPELNSPLMLDKMMQLEKSLEEINAEFSKKEAFYEIRCSCTLHSVLTKVMLKTRQNRGRNSENVASEIIGYIEKNYNREIKLSELGKLFGYHPNYLNSIFIKHTGKPIYSYLQEKRIMEAIHLLQNSNFSISDISSKIGFCDQAHFSKTFKKKTGLPPGRFRK